MLQKVRELLAERQAAQADASTTSLGEKYTSGPGRAFSSANLSGRLVVIEKGTVLDVVPYLRLYRVALLRGHVITCTYASEATFQPLGVTSATTIPPASTVLVARVPSEDSGIIIAVVPDNVKTYGDSPGDELVAGANAGFFGDLHQKTIMHRQPPGGGGIKAWKDNIVDSLPGDWIKFSRLGSSLFLTDFLSGFRVNEYCGIWLNYLDSLLRVSALNYQLWTSGSEEYSMLFWKAFLRYRGYGFTIRSQLGAKDEARSGNPFLDIDSDQYENPEARVSNIEPVTLPKGETGLYSRFPMHRVQEWEGALGQGGMKWVINSTNNGGPFPVPAAQEGTTSNGTFIVQSRSGILLAKYPYISAPLRASDPDENYGKPNPETFDGQLNTFLTKSNAWGFTGKVGLVQNMHPLDIRNLLCNWEAQAGFHLLPKKFKFLKETELYNYFKQGLYAPTGRNTAFSPSFFFMDSFGDIMIQNGQGASIELKGGKIKISAPEGISIDCGGKIVVFGKEMTVASETQTSLIAGEQIRMQVKQDEVQETPPSSGTIQEREDTTKINAYKDKEQQFVLSGTGNHQLTGCLAADYISVGMQRVGICTTMVAGGRYDPIPLPIYHEPVSWLYPIVASGRMNNYVPSKILYGNPSQYRFPSTLMDSGSAKVPSDVETDVSFTTIVNAFPISTTPQDMGFTNGVVVSN